MGAKMPLMVAQADEANNATDEMPAKAVLLCALRLAFFIHSNQKGARDEAKTH